MRFRTATFVALLLCHTAVNAEYFMHFMNNTHQDITLKSVCDDKLNKGICEVFSNGRVEPFKRVKTHKMSYDSGIVRNHRYTLMTYFSMPGDKKEIRNNYLSTVYEGDMLGSHVAEISITINGVHRQLVKASKEELRVEPNKLGSLHYKHCDGNTYTFYVNTQADMVDNQGINSIYFAIDKKPAILASESDNELTVITYNIQAYPYYMSEAVDLNKLNARIHYLAHAHALRQADVVVFEEAWDEGSRDMLKNLMHDVYPHSYDPIPPNTHEKPLNSGLLVLSRYPITKHKFINYQDHHSLVDADSMTNKGVIYLKLDKNGKPYNLIATNFQGQNDEKSVTVRQDQFELIKKHIIDCKHLAIPSHEPLLFAGDTNVSYYNKPAFEEMQKALNLDTSVVHSNLFKSPRFSYDTSINLMAKPYTHEYGLYDVVMAIKGFKKPSKSVSQITPLRALDSNKMYQRGMEPMSYSFGDVELSSHFMVQAKFIYEDK